MAQPLILFIEFNLSLGYLLLILYTLNCVPTANPPSITEKLGASNVQSSPLNRASIKLASPCWFVFVQTIFTPVFNRYISQKVVATVAALLREKSLKVLEFLAVDLKLKNQFYRKVFSVTKFNLLHQKSISNISLGWCNNLLMQNVPICNL